jgi:hypothetical protein
MRWRLIQLKNFACSHEQGRDYPLAAQRERFPCNAETHARPVLAEASVGNIRDGLKEGQRNT